MLESIPLYLIFILIIPTIKVFSFLFVIIQLVLSSLYMCLASPFINIIKKCIESKEDEDKNTILYYTAKTTEVGLFYIECLWAAIVVSGIMFVFTPRLSSNMDYQWALVYLLSYIGFSPFSTLHPKFMTFIFIFFCANPFIIKAIYGWIPFINYLI